MYNHPMISRSVALGALVGVLGCKSVDAGQLAAAAITVGAAVAAAAINRAATDECWGSCAPGSYCDGASGLCVAYREGDPAPEEPSADWAPCDHSRFICTPTLWLRCQQPCEWVLCEPRSSDTSGAPRRCCEQRCEWMQCPDDGSRCTALGHEPPRRDRLASPAVDPCRGLCVGRESCVVQDGVADCVVPSPSGATR